MNDAVPSLKDPADLGPLLRAALEAYAAMTPEEQAEMIRKQRESFVRGELEMGNDAEEAAYRFGFEHRRTGVEPVCPYDDGTARARFWWDGFYGR